MIRLAYIQRAGGEFFSEAAYCFWKGCGQLDIPTATFNQETGLEGLDITKHTLVYGGIGNVRKAFDLLGVKQPTVGEMPPEEVLWLYGRRVWATTMAEVRQGYEDGRHFFIKPLKVHKAFGGHVTTPSVGTLQLTAGFGNEFEVLASEVVNFHSEYRLFVHNGKVVASRFYRGDFRVAPDYAVADQFLAAIKCPPVAYSLDLGVDDDGRTLVVEMNDAFSLGHYGMASTPYAQMVIDRWEEIVGDGQAS